MSTQYFMSEVITAEEYVGYVRMVFQLQSAIDMVGLDSGIQVVNNKLRFYNEEEEDITPNYKDLKMLGVDTTLLLKHDSVISDCIVHLETTVQELYDKVCHAVVSDYGNIARYYRANEEKNLVPSFVYLREFDNQDESDKVKLLYEYQYLYGYINNLCNMNTNKGMEVVLRLIADELFVIFDEINARDIKTVSIGVEDFKDYSKLSFIVKTYDGRVETYPLLISDTFSYAVYSLFHVDSGYQIYDATLKEVYDILSEVVGMMVTSFNFVGFDEDIFNVVDKLRKLSVVVNSCEGSRKMKVVHTKETELVRSNDAKNLMLAKDLAMEFIDSGYDVVMRDGEDLVVYSSTDNSLQEYVPKSLQNIFYDVDKLDLLPLSYYVYMCK